MDALPFVAAFHQIAIKGKLSLFLLGDMSSKRVGVNPSFPFLRHFHHAGFMQVVVAQLGRGTHIGDMDKVIYVVGVVDDLADILKERAGTLRSSVQLPNLGGGQRFQPGRKVI